MNQSSRVLLSWMIAVSLFSAQLISLGAQKRKVNDKPSRARGATAQDCGKPAISTQPAKDGKAPDFAADLSLLESSPIKGRIKRLRGLLSDTTASSYLYVWLDHTNSSGRNQSVSLDNVAIQFYGWTSYPDRSCPNGERWQGGASPKDPARIAAIPGALDIFNAFTLVLVPRVERLMAAQTPDESSLYRLIPATFVAKSVLQANRPAGTLAPLEWNRNNSERSPDRLALLGYFTAPGEHGDCKDCFTEEEVLGAWNGNDAMSNYFKKSKDFWDAVCRNWPGVACPDWGKLN